MKNKRFLLLLIIITLWMTVPTTEAKAVSGFAGSGLTWEIRDSNTNITGYNKEFVLIIQGNGYLDSDISHGGNMLTVLSVYQSGPASLGSMPESPYFPACPLFLQKTLSYLGFPGLIQKNPILSIDLKEKKC